MNWLKNIDKFILKNISFIIIIFSVIAFFIPDNFSWMTKYTAIFLGVAMFGMGMTIQAEDFKNILLQPKYILVGCVLQYVIMPLTAWGIAYGLNLEPDLALGVILVGCCPGGTASNVITYIADGDVPLSVGMTIVSTLLAPIFTPFLVYALAGKWVDVSLLLMFKSVVNVILIPIFSGLIIRHLLRDYIQKFLYIMPLISATSIILIISGIIGANASKIATCGLLVLAVVILHNFAGITGGLIAAKLFKFEYKKATAVAIEVGMQNSGLAVSLAVANFALNPLATLPGAIFSVWHNISGSIFAGLRKRKKL